MIIFWLSVALMVLAALWLILRPLLSRKPLSALDQQDVNMGIYHRRVQELASDLSAGLLTEAAAAEAELELQRQLLGDLEVDEPAAPLQRRPAYWSALAVSILLPVVVLALYLHLGQPLAEEQLLAARDGTQDQVAFIREHLGELRDKVANEPENLEAVLMLGRAYVVLEDYAAATAVYADSESWASRDAAFLVDYAEALGYAQGGNLQGKPATLLQRALAVDPNFPKGLWLAGLAAMQADQAEETRRYWGKLVEILPPDSEPAAQLRQLLAEVEATSPALDEQEAAAAPRLEIEVSLAPELASAVTAENTLFVLARPASEQRTPLAAIRQTVEQFPVTVELDETMSMLPGMSLREFPHVVVEARISRSGDAVSQPGDLLGRSKPVSTASNDMIRIVIDRVVE